MVVIFEKNDNRLDIHIKIKIVESHLLQMTGSIMEHPYFCGCFEHIYLEFSDFCNVEKFLKLLTLEMNDYDFCYSKENAINKLFNLISKFANGEDDYYLDDLTLNKLL